MSEQPTTACVLWQDYAFLTQEVLKFVRKKDFDMVLELLAQRDKLQGLIEQTADNTFPTATAGQELLKGLATQNQTITTALQRHYNNAKRTQQVSHSYEGLSLFATGSFMDRQS